MLDGAFDRLIVSGDVILGGDVFVIGGADVGQTFELFTADNIVNTATWHLPGESSYQVVTLPSGQQSVQVTYVPEPGVGAVGALAMLAMGRGSRGRKRG